MNELRRKVIVSSEEPLKKQSTHNLLESHHEHANLSDEQHNPIQPMAGKKQPAPLALAETQHPYKQKPIKSQVVRKDHKSTQEYGGRPPKKLLMYHRKKQEVLLLEQPEPRIDIKPVEKKQQRFEDNSNKLPYRFTT